jgi:Tol biopolymer transport system component
VAFSLTDDSGVDNVWTIDRTGAVRQITHEPKGAHFPTWSPDGRLLAVEVYQPGEGTNCGVVDANGGVPTILTTGDDFTPGGREECYTGGWSPDGDKIAVVRRSAGSAVERWDVWWVSISTGERRRLTERPPFPAREFVRYPTWAPTGDRIYFELAQSSADIWLLDLASPGSS